MPTNRVALLTSDDAVTALLDQAGAAGVDGVLQRKARRALQQAMLEINSRRTWNYSRRSRVLNTNDSYDTGSISFDFTGGAYERLVTLTSGTFPSSYTGRSWLLIANKVYRVQKYLGATTLQLDESSNPGEDIASGTEYTLFTEDYLLPYDCASILTAWDMTSRSQLKGITPLDYENKKSSQYESGSPCYFTVSGDPWMSGALSVKFYPIPTDGRQILYHYDRTQQPLRHWKYNTGTVTVSANSTSLTGTGTAFTANMVGSVIRFGTTTTEPTCLEGSSPYLEERVISAYTSATALTLDEAVDSTYTAVKYNISDLVDVEPTAMKSAMMSCAGLHFAIERNADGQEQSLRRSAYLSALKLAMEADRRFEIHDIGFGHPDTGFPMAHTPTRAGYL